MSKATPGSQYIVQAGDTFESIAAQAYGDSALWVRISKANENEVRSDQLQIGQLLIIPILKEVESLKTSQLLPQLGLRDKDSLTILVGGIEVMAQEARITTAVDAVADGVTATIEWEPGKIPSLDRVLLPYSYSDIDVFIGTERLVKGSVYAIGSSLESETHKKVIIGAHKTADIIDSHIKSPYEQSSITLKDRAEELLTPLGINVIYDLDEDELFDRVTAKPSDKIFGHLVKLSTQRGILMTSSPEGAVVFTRAASQPVVGTLKEGDGRVTSWNAMYDGRTRFNAYKAISQSSGFNDINAIAIDNNIPKTRFKTFTASDVTNGNIQQSADWRRNKDVADSLKQTLPVSGWFAPDGSLFRKNTLITVESSTLHVPNGVTFLIRRVELILSRLGQTALLDLVPPELYTKEQVKEPWS